MNAQPEAGLDDTATLRAIALALPDVEEGVACVGTALESRSYYRGPRAFLFLGPGGGTWNARLKLKDSLPEATALSEAEPGRCRVGHHGWVTVPYGPGQPAPVALLRRWIAESHGLFPPKGGR